MTVPRVFEAWFEGGSEVSHHHGDRTPAPLRPRGDPRVPFGDHMLHSGPWRAVAYRAVQRDRDCELVSNAAHSQLAFCRWPD